MLLRDVYCVEILYFRIITAINNTLLEDLGYLSEYVLDGVIKVENQYTLGLEKSGLMINDSIDGNIGTIVYDFLSCPSPDLLIVQP